MSGQIDNPLARLETRIGELESELARLKAFNDAEHAVSKIAAPVAVPVAKERAQHAFSARFFALLDAGESLLMYSAALAFAPIFQAGGQRRDNLMEVFRQAPPLGKLNAELRIILDDPTINDWPITLLRTAFRNKNGKPTSTARYLLEELIRIRNDERGHGAQQPEGYYEDLYLRNKSNVHDCIRSSAQLELPLIHIHSVDNAGENSSYDVTMLMGPVPINYAERIVVPTRVTSGATCIWNRPDQRLLPLEPFVTYRFCTTCHLEHSFFAEKITADKIVYKSYVGNHHLTVDRPAA